METLFIVATKVEGLAQQVWLRVSKSLLVVMLWEQSIGVSHNQSEVMGGVPDSDSSRCWDMPNFTTRGLEI